VPISFPVQFPFIMKPAHVHFGEAGSGGAFEETGVCPALSALAPQAKPGELCVYVNTLEGLENATFEGIFKIAGAEEGAVPPGAVLKFAPTGVAYGAGSFAVTACTKNGPPVECPAGS
jgi:hypothetical protein